MRVGTRDVVDRGVTVTEAARRGPDYRVTHRMKETDSCFAR
jgi:hypothetical protein